MCIDSHVYQGCGVKSHFSEHHRFNHRGWHRLRLELLGVEYHPDGSGLPLGRNCNCIDNIPMQPGHLRKELFSQLHHSGIIVSGHTTNLTLVSEATPMNKNIMTYVRTAFLDQRGQVLPWVAFGMVA